MDENDRKTGKSVECKRLKNVDPCKNVKAVNSYHVFACSSYLNLVAVYMYILHVIISSIKPHWGRLYERRLA